MKAIKSFFNKKIAFSFLMILLIHTQTKAIVKLPYFFSDNMVLQQKTDAAIWGWAKAGSNIQIITSWNKKKFSLTLVSRQMSTLLFYFQMMQQVRHDVGIFFPWKHPR